MPDEPQAVTIRVQLSRSDLYRALVRTAFRKLWFLGVLIVAFMFVTLIASAEPRKYSDLIYGVLAAILFGACLCLGIPYIRTRAALRNPSLRGLSQYTFSAGGVLTERVHASGRIGWALVKGVSESTEHIFLWMPEGNFHLIPKGQVAAADLAALKSILRTCVKGKVALRP